MINDERVIALVPVRGGSKGIPRKNELDLGGQPLMSWAIEVALESASVDRVIVSTEDPGLAEIANLYNAEVYDRPAGLATDTVGVHQVILNLKERLRAEGEHCRYMVLLEATSPFRHPKMIEDALALLAQGYTSVASFCECRTHPIKAWKIQDQRMETFIAGADPWVTRQALAPAYELTGEVYAFELDAVTDQSASLLVGNCAPLVIDAEQSVDINTPRDLELARLSFAGSVLGHFQSNRASSDLHPAS